jgi:MraZ protein
VGGQNVFRGVNTLSLDAKGRMAMPSKYRDRLLAQCDGQMVVTVDRSDACLLLYPLPEWEDIERKLVRLGNLNPQARRLQRLLIGHATEVELDANGRILIPPPLREFARLDKRVALTGQGNKFEIWDETTWNEQRDTWITSDDDNAELSAELESLSL